MLKSVPEEYAQSADDFWLEYRHEVMSTCSPIKVELSQNEVDTLHAVMGISTEANEILDIIKKHIFYKKPLSKEHLIEEVGDLFWYIALLCEANDMQLSEILAYNVNKLRKRYPHGFDSGKAIKRSGYQNS